MSMKAIRAVVGNFEACVEHPNAPDDLRVMWEAAKKEIEALERIAVGACRGDTTHHLAGREGGIDLAELLVSIAKEAT